MCTIHAQWIHILVYISSLFFLSWVVFWCRDELYLPPHWRKNTMQFVWTHVADSLKQMPMSRAARSCEKHMLNFVNISQVWSQCLSFSMCTSKGWELYLLRSLNEVSYFQWKSLLAILRCSYLNVVWIPAFLGTSGVMCPLLCLFAKGTNREVYETSCDVYIRMFFLLCVLFAYCWVLRVLKTVSFYHIGGL